VLSEDDIIEHSLDDLLSRSLHVPVCLSPTPHRPDRPVFAAPVVGHPLFLLLMLGVIQAVYGLGAPLQEGLGWMLDQAKTRWIGAAAGRPSGLGRPVSCWRTV